MAFAPHSHFHQQSRSDNLLGLKVLHNIEDDLNISPVEYDRSFSHINYTNVGHGD